MFRFLLVLAIAALIFCGFYLLVSTNEAPDIIDIIRKIGVKFLDLWRK